MKTTAFVEKTKRRWGRRIGWMALTAFTVAIATRETPGQIFDANR